MIPSGGFDTASGKPVAECIVLEPPNPIRSFYYSCGKEFVIEPLQNLVQQRDQYLLAIITGSSIELYIIASKISGFASAKSSNNWKRIYHKSVDMPNHHGRGGSSAPRFQRLFHEAVQHYVKFITERMHENVSSQIHGIVLAGNADIKDKVYEQLPTTLRDRVVKRLTIDTHESIDDIIDMCTDILCNDPRVKEMNDIIERMLMGDSTIIYGNEYVLEALQNGRLRTLYMHPSIQTTPEISHQASQFNCQIICIRADALIQYGGMLGIAWY